jgi:hypothetical protein
MTKVTSVIWMADHWVGNKELVKIHREIVKQII